MRREVQRKVEGANPKDRSDRKTSRDAEAAATRRHQVERNRLADHSLRLFGGEAEGECAAINLGERVADRLPRLGGEQRSKFIALRCNASGDRTKDRCALPGAERAQAFESRNGASGRALDLIGRGEIRRPNKVSVKWRANLMRAI